MIETQHVEGESLPPPPPGAPSPQAGRRRWLTAAVVTAVAIAGVGIGIALTQRDDAPTRAIASDTQLAALDRACTDWLDADPRPESTPGPWCDDMAGWMNQQIAGGSMTHQMMWGDPDRMLTTCRAWMEASPSVDLPDDWCDAAITGMWQHMSDDWDHRDEWNDWMTNHPMMSR
jgi:hypothetical protein